MNRSSVVRAIVAFGVLVAATWVTLTASPTLGLDLRGGTQLVLETQSTPTVEADATTTDNALEVLRRRVDALGVAEPSLTRSGQNRIIVELPGVDDPQEANETLGKTAQLTFHPVVGVEGQTPPEAPDSEATANPDPGATPDATPTEGDAGGAPDPGAAATDDGTTEDTQDGAEQSPAPTPNEDGSITLPDEGGLPLQLGPPALTGEGVTSADAAYDVQSAGGWFVSIDFNGDGSGAWRELTGQAACFAMDDPSRRIAIVLDSEIISSPRVIDSTCDVGQTGGSTRITGDFSQEEATDLAALIQGGSLPVPVETIESRTVGPTLGADAIEASAYAALIGMALTGIYIIFAYRLVGLMAVFALIGYAAISYATLATLGATLTLPGLAGFVLAIGMAVDANVLIFERAREDFVEGKTKTLLRGAQSGFKNAFSAIADSNITTLLAAGLLFFLASGPVRGFGVTLSIGVLASMLSALVVSRVLVEWLVQRQWVRNRPAASGIAKHGRVRLWLRRRDLQMYRSPNRWIAVSAIAIVIALAGVGFRGLNFGIEFTGGRQIAVATQETVDAEVARAAVSEAGFPTAVVQEAGDADISVRTADISDAEANEITDAIGAVSGGAEKVRDELIGPSLGSELMRNALIALAVALTMQLAYLAIRFRWTLGTGAVVALFQNIIVVIGFFAWLGKPIDGIFLAALLTIIGYTVNDSVVVFDRIREHWTRKEGESFAAVCNTAVLNTLPRTINTGISTVFILAALLFLGGESLSDFALALLIGILIGIYSSNFTATPVAISLEGRWPAPIEEEKKEPPKGRRSREDPNYGAVV